MSTMSETRRIAPIDESGNELAPHNAFGSNAVSGSELARHGGALSSIAREESEMKAAMVLARTHPRDESAAYVRIIKSCDRPNFAESALYRFPRGGGEVSGPSVDMARELARCWGNVRYGLRIVTMDQRDVHIKGFAYDLETNNYVEAEDKFARLIQRKVNGVTQWVPPDERDLRELVNRRGAICVRNAILQVMPPDVVDDAVNRVMETMRKAARGDIKADPAGATRRMVVAFSELGVTVEMISAKIKCAIEAITGDQLAELREIYKSMCDGVSKREDHFVIPQAKSQDQTDQGGNSPLSRLKQQAAAVGTAPQPETKPQVEEPKPEAAESPDADPDKKAPGDMFGGKPPTGRKK